MHKRLLAFSLLLLGMALSRLIPLSGAANGGGGVVTTELWCVAKNNAEDAALQTALNWACGEGGADCSPIQEGGPCYGPSDIQNTASYAFNDYFLKHGMTDQACNFQNTAALTSLNPSHDKCKFPSSLSATNASISSPSAASGMGPSENLNGGSYQISQQWFCTVATTLLVLAYTWLMG